MADIRINSLPTTASASSSDDFLALDGATNGTRKLNAFSPSFGGNLTVSGTGTNLFGGGSRDAFVIESDTAGNGAFASAKNAAANDYEPLSLIGETITLKYRSGVNSSTAGLTLTSTGTTLAGNLTVSGTGTSSVAGNFGLGTTTPTAGQLHISGNSDSGSAPNRPRIGLTNLAGTAQTWTIQAWQTSGDANLSIYRTAAAGGILLASTGGSVGVGVTSFSGSGALELATHTTRAGGIGFGTDTSLFRSSAGILSIGDGTSTRGLIINGAAANAQVLLFQQAGTEVARIGLSASTSLLFATGANVTALTLDSSQNATFAGAVTASKAYQDITSGLSTIYAYSTDTATQDKGGTIQLGGAYTGTTTTTFGGIRGSKESTTAGETGGQLEFFTRSNGGAMARRAYISSTGAATFTGNIGAGGVNPVVAYSSGGSFYGSGANPQVRLVATSTGGWAFSTYTNVSATGNWSAGLQATGQTYRITNDLDLNGTAALSIAPTTLATTFGGTISTSAPTGGAGAWELGVYTATAPTATGYVTIEIGGTQYKLLAATA